VAQHGLNHDRFEIGIPPEMILMLAHSKAGAERGKYELKFMPLIKIAERIFLPTEQAVNQRNAGPLLARDRLARTRRSAGAGLGECHGS